MDPQLTSLVISEVELKNIEICLDKVREEIQASCIMLLDHSGQIIASHSRRNGIEETTVGALLAGTFSSSRELARALKEPEFKSLTQQGMRENIYAEIIQEQWILALIFQRQVLLGLVKVVCKQAVSELEQILSRIRTDNRTRDRLISANMQTSLRDTIDLLFADFDESSGVSNPPDFILGETA